MTVTGQVNQLNSFEKKKGTIVPEAPYAPQRRLIKTNDPDPKAKYTRIVKVQDSRSVTDVIYFVPKKKEGEGLTMNGRNWRFSMSMEIVMV
jgi:hypothetical protein